jgi:hypothetical protein
VNLALNHFAAANRRFHFPFSVRSGFDRFVDAQAPLTAPVAERNCSAESHAVDRSVQPG